VPAVLPLFWSFRTMVGLGFFFIALFATTFYFVSVRKIQNLRPLLWVLLLSLPLPWIAAELGWFVSEVGRQPWVIEGVLPTFLAVSSLSAANVMITLVGFVLFYSTLLVVDIYLMVKTVKTGPGPLPPHAAAPAAVLPVAAE
jgi:cytochrome d ubiquinol oxidase subunit I